MNILVSSDKFEWGPAYVMGPRPLLLFLLSQYGDRL